MARILYKCNTISQKIYGMFYNKNLRKKLKNHNFSILCSSCMGGIIYHRLGEKFCSPTINLWMFEDDFQKFCLNFNYYKICKLRFVDSEKKYPVAKLGEASEEVTIYFLHYVSQSEAEEKWYQRIKRVDIDNLFVIASDVGMSEEQLKKWDNMQCRNKVVFVAQEYSELPYTFFLEKCRGKDNVGKYVNDVNKVTGLRYVETIFDFVDFLNKV